MKLELSELHAGMSQIISNFSSNVCTGTKKHKNTTLQNSFLFNEIFYWPPVDIDKFPFTLVPTLSLIAWILVFTMNASQ